MSSARLLLVLAVLGAGVWLIRSQHLLGPAAPESGSGAAVERARAAARTSDAGTAQRQAASRDIDSQASGPTVGENMTPEQVRALLGPPDAVDSEATESGAAREKWMYRQAGKTVVFENGVVARIE